jgi:hypothetical protein
MSTRVVTRAQRDPKGSIAAHLEAEQTRLGHPCSSICHRQRGGALASLGFYHLCASVLNSGRELHDLVLGHLHWWRCLHSKAPPSAGMWTLCAQRAKALPRNNLRTEVCQLKWMSSSSTSCRSSMVAMQSPELSVVDT